VRKGAQGNPGELKGDFTVQRDVGSLQANTDCGVFGSVSDANFIDESRALPVASRKEVHTGAASILATVSGEETVEYAVEIDRIYVGEQPTRNMLIRVTDERLLSATGGIVQGMSGSPIIQDGKLVGAVTHVLVNDPTRGYGIFIENMLDAAG
jgi:stage IV sporulation protein B